MRKGNLVATQDGTSFGKVTSMKGDIVEVEINGFIVDVPKASLTRISASEAKMFNTPKPVKEVAVIGVSKKHQAQQIFNSMKGKEATDIISAFKADVGLTVNGARTYYRNFKTQFWAS